MRSFEWVKITSADREKSLTHVCIAAADAGDTGAQVLSVWHQVQAMYGDGCELPDDIAAPNLNRSVTLGTDITSLSRSPVAPGPGKWFDHSGEFVHANYLREQGTLCS